MPSETSTLLHLFIDRVPNAGRTQLVKFLYLADLAAREYLGRPLTDLQYIWYDHGPFDSRVYVALEKLAIRGNVREAEVKYANGKKAFRYTSITRAKGSLNPDEAAILDFVVAKFGTMSLDALLKHVYDTPPMKEAKRLKAKDKALAMSKVNGANKELFERIRIGVKQLDKGEKIPLSKFRKSMKI